MTNSASSQQLKPIADDTLSSERSVVTPLNSHVDRIDGGAIRKANLFHSFSQFNIGENAEVYFANPSGVENILTRVTGTDPSKIFGKLGVLGNANLFLINPNGIIFGKNAKLDIHGSFIASTASAVQFADETKFSANQSQGTPLLTISVPQGLQFGGTAGGISVQGSSLVVQSGKTLALVGGDVGLDGGSLQAANGRVELGGLATPGTVGIEVNGNNLSLGFPNSTTKADVSVTNGASVNAIASGNIAINAPNLDIFGGSTLKAEPQSRDVVGEISVTANDLRVSDGASLRAESRSDTPGGNINIHANRVELTGGGQLVTTAFGKGNAGNINLNVKDRVVISGSNQSKAEVFPLLADASGIFANTTTAISSSGVNVTGNGGNLAIETKQLLVRDGGQITTSADRNTTGNAGNITVRASDIEVSGVAPSDKNVIIPSLLATATQGAGNAGKLDINTERLTVQNGGGITAAAIRNTQDGGNLTINASEFVKITGGSTDGMLVSGLSVDTAEASKVGSLTLKTRKLILSNGAGISASTFGSKQGGDINLTATDLFQINGTGNNGFASGVYAQTYASGNAGSISISTGQLSLSDGATITVASRTATDTRVPVGLLSFASFNISNTTVGKAGNLDIAAKSISLNNQSRFLASTASGQGGNIRLQIGDILLLRRDSQTSTTAGTAGDGGNITINDPQNPRGFIVAAPNENSDITANALTGSGGKIQIYATGIFGFTIRSLADLVNLLGSNTPPAELDPQKLPTNDITAISQTKPDFKGRVTINTLLNPVQGLTQLPTNLVDPSNQIVQGCSPRVGKTASRFIATGRGGLPQSPDQPLQGRAVITGWVSLDSESDNSIRNEATNTQKYLHPATPVTQIVEANGWVVDKNGDTYLIAKLPVDTPHSSPFLRTACSQ